MTQKLRTFFHIFRNSLANLDYYRQLPSMPLGFSLKYLVGLLYMVNLILFLPLIVELATLFPQLPSFASQGRQTLQALYPAELVIRLQHGQLSANVPQPYTIDLPGKAPADPHFLTIDTNTKVEDYAQFHSFVLVTQNSLIYPSSSSSNNQTEVLSLTNFSDTVINHTTYLKAISNVLPVFDYLAPLLVLLLISLLILGPVLATLVTLPFKLIHLLIITLLVYLVTRVLDPHWQFAPLFKLALHASTLPIVFFGFLDLLTLSPTIPFGYSLLLLIILCAVLLQFRRAQS